jgi:hypothetical protein
MTATQKALIGSTGALLIAFVVFDVHMWVRYTQAIPFSWNCTFSLARIGREHVAVYPFYFVAFAIGVCVFEFSRRQMPRSWRFAYLLVLGFGAASLILPWIVAFV